MSEPAFTKGPWPWQVETGSFEYVLDAEGDIVAMVDRENHAAARLIAAAPALYEALERIAALQKVDDEMGDTTFDIARAALASARGETQ